MENVIHGRLSDSAIMVDIRRRNYQSESASKIHELFPLEFAFAEYVINRDGKSIVQNPVSGSAFECDTMMTAGRILRGTLNSKMQGKEIFEVEQHLMLIF